MGKGKKKSDLASLFKNPWCPLFGHLPDYSPHSMIARCVSIIYSARLNWNISDDWKGNSYPIPEDTGYSGITLLTARAIFNNIPMIQYKAYHPGYEEPDNPFIIKMFDIIYKTKGVLEEVSEEKLFSLLAINYAWVVIKDILHKGIPEDNPIILRRILYASNLLSRADYYKDAFFTGCQINTLDQQIKAMLPDVKELQRRHEAYSKGGRKGRIEDDPLKKELKENIFIKRDELAKVDPNLKGRPRAKKICRDNEIARLIKAIEIKEKDQGISDEAALKEVDKDPNKKLSLELLQKWSDIIRH